MNQIIYNATEETVDSLLLEGVISENDYEKLHEVLIKTVEGFVC